MDVVSLCPLRASGFEWQSPRGARALTVLCKATFELSPGEARLAKEQEVLSDEDVYGDDNPLRSLCSSTDIAPYKPRADVVLVGHAYAPRQQPTRSFRARLIVGEIDKSIEVWCHRGYRAQDGQVLEGQRITKMDLRWERASGGPETNNPVGKRFDGPPDAYGTVWIGNLQPPGLHIASRLDTFTPICFAPIAPTWPSRVQKLHRHARSFAAQGWQGAPLPEDFDYGYFNIAPPDQQSVELRANERIVLENLHPPHEKLVTSLPGLRPRAIADRATGEREEIALVADTLWIDSDRGICTMVWRGRLGLRSAREAGRVAFWVDGLPAVAPSAEAAVPVVHSDSSAIETITLVQSGKELMASTLPFVPGPPAQPPRAVEGAGRPLAWAEALVAAIDPNGDGTGTLVAGFAAPVAIDTLPFVKGAPEAPKEAPLPPPLFVSSSVPLAMEPEPETTRGKQRVEAKAAMEVHPVDVAPPAMIGPLATPEMVAPVTKEEPVAEGEAAAPEAPEAVAPMAPVKKGVGPEEFGLERCAALTAHIARNKPAKATILESEELTAEEWAAIEMYWADAIGAETKRGKKALLDRFDAAYVEQLEKERGPIGVEEYAKLKVATERGTVHEELAELGLPRGAIMRIERVWMTKLARDAGLGYRANEAVERAREG